MRINRLDSTAAVARILLAAMISWVFASDTGRVHSQVPAGPAQTPQLGEQVPLTPGPQLAGPKPVEPPSEAERFIDLAIKKISRFTSVSADVVQEVKMLKQEFKIQGRYLRAPGTRIRMDLTVSGLPDTQAKLLQVCDGETLWEYQQVFEAKFCNKKSIKPILERLNSPELDAETRERATVQIGVAGPEALLMGLRKSIKFTHMEEGTLDGKPMMIAEGEWRDRTGLVGPDQQQVAMLGALPSYIPSLAKVYLGKEDNWPYKVSLLGKVTTLNKAPMEKGPDGKLRAKPLVENVPPTNIVLTYTNVRFNEPISVDEFKFDPPKELPTEDITEAILSSLDQAIKIRSATKKMEAPKQEIPTLDKSIVVPKVGGDPLPQ